MEWRSWGYHAIGRGMEGTVSFHLVEIGADGGSGGEKFDA
jgi:hypothetical protein